MRHIPRKRFGQHFLQDDFILHQFIEALQARAEDNLLEIGPGQGALTQYLMHTASKLKAIELDRDLLANLQKRFPQGLELTSGDALTADYRIWGDNLRVVGNLPYNISTPLLFHLLSFSNIQDMHFMLQKEVVDRIVSPPGSKVYGRLSVMIQYYCEVEWLFDVPADAFDPPPKVVSAVIRLTPHQQCPYPTVDHNIFARTVAQAFASRRKTLANNFKSLINKEIFTNLGIDSNLRPEQLTVFQFVTLAQSLQHTF